MAENEFDKKIAIKCKRRKKYFFIGILLKLSNSKTNLIY